MPKPASSETGRVTVILSPDVKRRAALYCVRASTTLTSLIERALVAFMRANPPGREQEQHVEPEPLPEKRARAAHGEEV